MRVIEGLIFIFNIIVTILFIVSGFEKIRWTKYIPLVTVVLLLVHFIIEKSRWQLYPLYLVTVLYLLMIILNKTSKAHPKKMIIAILVLLTFISVVLAYIFPVYEMPIPEGEFEIGTQSFDLRDPDRNAIYSSNLSDKRKIRIQFWYPAENIKGCKKVPWIRGGKIVATELAKEMKLPSFAFDQTTLIRSNSYEQAPISKKLKNYPVIILSHGWTGFTDIHADQAEELASRGYIVVGIDHTFGSQITVFNDGEVSHLNRNALPDAKSVPNFLEYANKLVTTYGGDVKLTLNELEKLNANDIGSSFYGKLDLSNIGLLGHSTGGGGDVSLALEDTRIKAIVGMDAWVEPIDKANIEKGLKVPTLFLRSEQWKVGANNKNLIHLIDKSTGPISLYQINGINHADFTMVYRYSPLTKYMKLSGKLDGGTSSSIQKDFIDNFFDQYLKDKQSIDINKIAKKWKQVKKIK